MHNRFAYLPHYNLDIIVHYDNNPFWISADTIKDDLEWPWMTLKTKIKRGKCGDWLWPCGLQITFFNNVDLRSISRQFFVRVFVRQTKRWPVPTSWSPHYGIVSCRIVRHELRYRYDWLGYFKTHWATHPLQCKSAWLRLRQCRFVSARLGRPVLAAPGRPGDRAWAAIVIYTSM